MTNVFRSIGCKISTLGGPERAAREKLGRTVSPRGGGGKLAKLVAPLTFPDGGTGKKRG